MIIVIRRNIDKVSGLILGDICYIYIFSLDIFLSNHFKKYYNFLKFQDSSLDPVLQQKVCLKSPSANVRICDKEALKVNNRKYKNMICKVFFQKMPNKFVKTLNQHLYKLAKASKKKSKKKKKRKRKLKPKKRNNRKKKIQVNKKRKIKKKTKTA